MSLPAEESPAAGVSLEQKIADETSARRQILGVPEESQQKSESALPSNQRTNAPADARGDQRASSLLDETSEAEVQQQCLASEVNPALPAQTGKVLGIAALPEHLRPGYVDPNQTNNVSTRAAAEEVHRAAEYRKRRQELFPDLEPAIVTEANTEGGESAASMYRQYSATAKAEGRAVGRTKPTKEDHEEQEEVEKGARGPLPKLSIVAPELLDRYLRELFALADANNNGVLERDEFVNMFKLSGYDFSEGTMDAMFTMADLDGDGVIQLEEALPYVRAVVTDEGFAVPQPMPKLSAVSPELLDRYLKELFALADENNDGVLQKEEFFQMMQLSGFTFSIATMHGMLMMADINGDGIIQYEEAVPYLRCLITDAGYDGVPALSELSPQLLDRYLTELFALADENRNGVLERNEFVQMFKLSGFEFSEGTMDAMFTMADLDGDGVIQLEEALPYVRAVVTDSAVAVPKRTPTLSEMSPQCLDRYLEQLFEEADENKNGLLEKEEFVKMLLLTGFDVADPVTFADQMFIRADSNDDGVVQIEEAIPIIRAALTDRTVTGCATNHPKLVSSTLWGQPPPLKGRQSTKYAFEQRVTAPPTASRHTTDDRIPREAPTSLMRLPNDDSSKFCRNELYHMKDGKSILLTPATDAIAALRSGNSSSAKQHHRPLVPNATQKKHWVDRTHRSVIHPVTGVKKPSWLEKMMTE